MKTLRTLLVAGVLAHAAGCAPAGVPDSPAPGAGDAPRVGEVPRQVGPLTLTATERLTPASAGTAYRFRGSPPVQPDVFIYRADGTALAAGSAAADRVRAESELFPSALAYERDRGRYQAFAIASDSAYRVPASAGIVEGWHTVAMLRTGQGVLESHQHLFSIGDDLVKIRTTYPLGMSDGAVLHAFVRDFIGQLVGR